MWEDDGVHDEELVVCLGSAERTVEDGEGREVGVEIANLAPLAEDGGTDEEDAARGGRVGIIEPDETPDLAVVPLAVFAVRHGVRARGRHRGRRRVKSEVEGATANVRATRWGGGRPCAERRRRRRPHARVRARRAREERSPLWSNPTLARVARDVKCDFSVPAGGSEAPLAARDIHAATFGEATDPDGQRVPRAATRDYGGVGGDRGRAGARAGAVGGPRPRGARGRGQRRRAPSAGQRRAARGAHGAETGFGSCGRRANGGRRRPRPRVARLRRCAPPAA